MEGSRKMVTGKVSGIVIVVTITMEIIVFIISCVPVSLTGVHL